MRFTRHQLREATIKAKAIEKANHRFGLLTVFALGCLVGLGTLHIIELIHTEETIFESIQKMFPFLPHHSDQG